MSIVSMRKLILPISVLHSVTEHAQTLAPAEAVGIIGGDASGRAACAIRCKNLGGVRSFFVDPYSQYQAITQLRTGGRIPLAVYHSHPGGGIELSPLDRQFAVKVGLIQLVLVPANPRLPNGAWGAYWVTDAHHYEKVEVVIDTGTE